MGKKRLQPTGLIPAVKRTCGAKIRDGTALMNPGDGDVTMVNELDWECPICLEEMNPAKCASNYSFECCGYTAHYICAEPFIDNNCPQCRTPKSRRTDAAAERIRVRQMLQSAHKEKYGNTLSTYAFPPNWQRAKCCSQFTRWSFGSQGQKTDGHWSCMVCDRYLRSDDPCFSYMQQWPLCELHGLRCLVLDFSFHVDYPIRRWFCLASYKDVHPLDASMLAQCAGEDLDEVKEIILQTSGQHESVDDVSSASSSTSAASGYADDVPRRPVSIFESYHFGRLIDLASRSGL